MDSVTVTDGVMVMKARTGSGGVEMCLTATVYAEKGMFGPDSEKGIAGCPPY
jgi:hypothetical protein